MTIALTDITYRKPERQDAAAMSHFGRKTFSDTFAHLYKPQDLSHYLNRVYTPAVFLADLATPGTEFRVAEHAGQIIGFCKIGSVTVPINPVPPRSIELRQLYVDHGYHGSGVAATLMAWALDRAFARECETVYLSVYAENFRAQRFYERHGFKTIGEYKFMVGNQADDELIMMLRLCHDLTETEAAPESTPAKDSAR